MSRIGKLPIAIPAGVEVKVDGDTVTVKGPKGELSQTFSHKLAIEIEDGNVEVKRADDEQESRSLHGLTRTLIHNMVVGVTEGYSKKLVLVGVGYRAQLKGSDLQIFPSGRRGGRGGHKVRVPLANRDHRQRYRQAEGRTGCRRHPRLEGSGALQGQGNQVRWRESAPQARQGSLGRLIERFGNLRDLVDLVITEEYRWTSQSRKH